jgi:5'-3' exonuclease
MLEKKYCLVDVSTIIYQAYYRFAKQFGKRAFDPKTTTAFLLDQLNALIEPGIQPGYLPIYLYDRKKDGVYWRQEFINDHAVFYSELWAAYRPKELDTGYKGGRLKPEDYNVLLKYTRDAAELLKNQGPWFGAPGLEADDFAGLFVKYKPEDVYLDLLTVDRDWCGLTSPGVRWINMLPKKRYQIETEIEAVEYFKAKLDSAITAPYEAYEAKRVKGELGDQLPPGCHIKLIDIVNHAAPIDYGFAQDHQDVINFYKA